LNCVRDLYGTSHIPNIYEWPPRAAIAEHFDLTICEGTRNKIVENKIKAQAVQHPASGYKAQASY
jgi:hypothetical protein